MNKYHKTSLHVADLKVVASEAGFPNANQKKIAQAKHEIYQASEDRKEACSPHAAYREWEASLARSLEQGSIEEAKKLHLSKDEFFRSYQELYAQESHRHGLLYKNEIAPPLIPLVENLRDICLTAAEKDEEWTRQACSRVGVPYSEENAPYSAVCLRTRARVLEAVIENLRRGDPGQGSPKNVLGLI
jgi:hypothetical protein